MRTMLLTWTAGAAVLVSLFWCSLGHCVMLLLTVWVIAIASFVYSNLKDKLLCIPVLLAGLGVLGLIFVLAIPGKITLAANVAVLVTFVISLEVLKKKPRSSIACMRHRA